MFLGFLFVAIAFGLTQAEKLACPSIAQMGPCKCDRNWFKIGIFCKNGEVEQIRKALEYFAQTNRRFTLLKIEQIHLGNLSSSLLVGLGLDLKHQIFENCNLSSVDDDAFDDVAGNVTTLDFSHNALERVPSRALQNMSSLTHLYLDHNRIEVLHAEAFKGLHSLKTLYLRSNGIKFIHDFAFVGIEGNLKQLNIGDNEIASVPLQAIRNLVYLEALALFSNSIATLQPEMFANVATGDFLSDLNLGRNTIRELPPRAFASLKRLRMLDLTGNLMESVHPSAFEGIEDTLLYLKLAENRLDEVPNAALKNLSRLEELQLQGNNICEIRKGDFMPYGKNLEYIYLGNNSLTYLDPEIFVHLQSLAHLWLRWNQLNTVPYKTYAPVLDTLQRFDLHGNPLHCDCGISWLRDWMKGNGSKIVLLPNEVKCASPEDLAKAPLADTPRDGLVCRNSTPASRQNCISRGVVTQSNRHPLYVSVFVVISQLAFTVNDRWCKPTVLAFIPYVYFM